jgi:hypothetical protein
MAVTMDVACGFDEVSIDFSAKCTCMVHNVLNQAAVAYTKAALVYTKG